MVIFYVAGEIGWNKQIYNAKHKADMNGKNT